MLKNEYQIDQPEVVDLAYERIYDNFIKMVDGKDNGVEQYTKTEGERYRDDTGLNSRVARLNTSWNEKGNQDERFL